MKRLFVSDSLFTFEVVKRTVIIFSIVLALLIVGLKVAEHKFLARDLSTEFYIGIIGLVCAGLGVWLGLKAFPRKKILVPVEFVRNDQLVQDLGISKRELEVLELMAKGLSNQEIGEELFVSLSTIKTHATNIFVKLDVKRRTQAVQKAKEMSIIE